ncbi:MAG: PAS domain S-box-containing protein [Candidatus Aldehydirespiratoraceae bacterium]|jgi:PAS domain S-box-containing protein
MNESGAATRNEAPRASFVPSAIAAATLEHAGEFHVLSDANGQMIWVSESVRSVLGYEPSEYLNVASWTHVHPDDVDRWQHTFEELVEEIGGRRRLQFRSQHADGTWRWVENVATNLLDRPGVEGIVTTVRDVTSRVSAKRRHSQSERRLRSIVSSASDIIAILDERGTIDYITPTVATILQQSSTALQEDWMSYVHPDDLGAMQGLFSLALEEPGVTQGPMDMRLLRGDGEWTVVEALITDYRSDPIVRGIVLNARDVTARREVEAEKEANQTIFNALVEMAPIGIFLADLDNKWSYVNARIAADFGVEPESLRGTGWMALFDAADVVRVRSELALWDGSSALVTELRTRTSPDARELRLTMSRPSSDGSSYGMVGTLEDVTDRRAVDDMLVEGAALGSVADVVGSAAHDLHNLLASIGMQLGLLDPATVEGVRVQAAEEAIDRACNIAEDLMEMSRPSRGRVHPLEIGPIVGDLANMLRVLVDHHADLTFEDRSDGLSVAADRSGVERIVTNLVVNARDAVEPRGKIRIEVTAVVIDEADIYEGGRAGEHVAISVMDNGCGIPAAFRDRVFEPHFTTKEDGNGIGLAASRRNVRIWAGDLRFSSEEGRGTTFTLLLPVF